VGKGRGPAAGDCHREVGEPKEERQMTTMAMKAAERLRVERREKALAEREKRTEEKAALGGQARAAEGLLRGDAELWGDAAELARRVMARCKALDADARMLAG
jgi:hypothetical protein